jgi:hypothetical protein
MARLRGSDIVDETLTGSDLQDGTVVNADLANMAQSTIKGRAAGAGTGVPTDLTSAQATEILDAFPGDSGSGSVKGLVPSASAGDGAAAKFLKADGTWAVPTGSGITQLTGEVTAGPGSGSQAATIANDAVTNAKLANMAANTIKGNNTGVSADPLDLTTAQVKTMLNLTGTNSGDQTITLTGDVTGSGTGSFAATIANDAVTFAKMQNIATDSLIGRDTAGTGDPENILLNATLSMDGAGNLQRAALTGDVTAPAGSNATTIANDAVTYAKMQNVSAASKLLGRGDSGSGDVEEITLGSGLTMTGTTLSASGGGGSGVALEQSIAQTSHGFSVGNIIYYTGSAYAKAKADADATSEGLGVVSVVTDANNFKFISSGLITTLSGLTAGTTYFLSAATAGAATSTEPSTAGYVSKPVYVAVSTTSAYILNHRGAIIGSSASTVDYAFYGRFSGSASTTSTSYAIPTSLSSMALTSVLNENMGSVVIYNPSSATFGVTFTPPALGVYAVTYSCYANSNTNETYGQVALTTSLGGDYLDEQFIHNMQGTTNRIQQTMHLSGIFKVTSLSSMSVYPLFKIFNSGTMGLTGSGIVSYNEHKIRVWKIN